MLGARTSAERVVQAALARSERERLQPAPAVRDEEPAML
jgi:hypothetical protein